MKKRGYEAEIIKLVGSFIKGRDVRAKKLITMTLRSLIHFRAAKHTMDAYVKSYKSELAEGTKELFHSCYNKYVGPHLYKEGQLKRIAHGDEFVAFICGSDQVWNATALYVDPFYYLKFAPKKRFRICAIAEQGDCFLISINSSFESFCKRNGI